MKAILKVAFFVILLFSSCVMTYGLDTNNGVEIVLKNISDETKDETGTTAGETVPIRRSITLQSAYAYIYNNVVNINFTESLADVTVTITNEVTGEVVYSEINNSSTNITLDLKNQGKGEYTLEIKTDNVSLEGTFSL